MSDYVIGIDGGGTGTRGALADTAGRVHSFACGEATNHYEVGIESAHSVLCSLVDELRENLDKDNDHIVGLCMGLAGVGRPEDKELFSNLLPNLPGGDNGLVVNDAVIALAGGTLSDVGILAISGTGSIYFGRDKSGQTRRVGGWGTLLGDEASGYQMGLEGLRAVVRSHDGREMETILTQSMLDRLEMTAVEELVRWSLSDQRTKSEIAQLAGEVIIAAHEKDSVACRIVGKAADEIALSVNSIVKQLDLGSSFPVVLAGGMFNTHQSFFDEASRKIRFYFPGADCMHPQLPAFAGALLYSLASCGIEVNEQLLQNLRESCSEETEIN
jgi:N-acetylglucosamine kinase-like BadF-type ATPase